MESMQTFTLEPGRPKSHRGGKRPGAGRPKGSPNKAPLDRLYRVMVDGHTPLEVMLANMRRYYKEAVESEEASGKLANELRSAAQQCAMQAAPYCHSRHTNSVVRHELAVAELSDDELAMIAGRAKTIEHASFIEPTKTAQLPVRVIEHEPKLVGEGVVLPNRVDAGYANKPRTEQSSAGTKPFEQFQAVLPNPWGK